jgi:hypothetical protein
MAKYNLDLEGANYPGGEPYPESPGNDEKNDYPQFTYYHEEEFEGPEEGIMTIRYCKVKSDHDTRRPADKQYSCTLGVEEIISVKAVKSEAPASRDRSAEESLDALAAEKSKENDAGEGY